jgi:mannose-6-phosphate isomerase-like protein (cupin superfamily)
MIRHVRTPALITAQGNKPKSIEEFIGRVNTDTHDLSIARMTSPAGWVEPGQTPEFDEYSVILRGVLRVATRTETIDVKAGESIFVEKGEWVQYSTPTEEGAVYIAVCRPAFSPRLVHRDEE